MKTKLAVSVAFVLAISAQAFAQKGGFGGEFGDRGGAPRIRWSNNVDKIAEADPFEERRRKAMGLDPVDKRYMFVYIRPIAEMADPGTFNSTDIAKLSNEAWVFVKMDFDKDNAFQKGWGVKAAPMIIGCDLHANDFVKTNSIALDSIRRVTGGLPELVVRYEQKLKSDYAKANDLAKSDEAKAVKLYVDIVADGKKGYKEVEESMVKVGELAQSALKKSELPESVSPEAGIDYLDDVVKAFKGTPPGVEAEIRIARLDHERGNVQPAILRLMGILKYDSKLKTEIEHAVRALEEIARAGETKVELAVTGDKTLAKETLRKLAKDYAGTDTSKKALEASKRFE
ncbi:MAG TPA: hypothetical protein VJB14_07965 [Planctomycetota bacterium]|nr:hypothetical protein [Planctomycetota bacterium]